MVSKEDPKIFTALLRTCTELLLHPNQALQESFKDEIIRVGSFQLFNKIIILIRKSIPTIERIMSEKNSIQLAHILVNSAEDAGIVKNSMINISITQVSLSTNFLRLLCEGHNHQLQEFLSIQTKLHDLKSSDRNIDLVEMGAELLKSVTKFLNRECIELVIDVLSFLSSTLTGPCEMNQKKLIKYQILDACRDILFDLSRSDIENLISRGFIIDDPESARLIAKADMCVIKLLLSLLEDNHDRQLMLQMSHLITFDIVMMRLTHIYINYFTRLLGCSLAVLKQKRPDLLIWELKSKTFDREIAEAFHLFSFLRLIEEHIGVYTANIDSLTGVDKDAYSFFSSNTGSMEIIMHGNLQKTYFPIHPACYYLSGDAQEEIMNSVRRTNENEKVSDFVSASQSLFNQMDYTFELRNKYHINPTYLYWLRVLTFTICVVLNLYLFSLVQFKMVQNDFLDDPSQYSQTVVLVMAILYLVFSIFFLVLFLASNVRIGVLNSWVSYFHKIKHMKSVTPVEKVWLQARLDKDIFDYSYQDYSDLITFKRLKEGNPNTFPRLTKISNDLSFTNSQLFVIMFYITCFLSGIFTDDKMFYALPLLDALVSFG